MRSNSPSKRRVFAKKKEINKEGEGRRREMKTGGEGGGKRTLLKHGKAQQLKQENNNNKSSKKEREKGEKNENKIKARKGKREEKSLLSTIEPELNTPITATMSYDCGTREGEGEEREEVLLGVEKRK